MRTITAVTVGRSDWGIYRPILNQIRATPGLRLQLIASGAHFSPIFGSTIETVQADGFEPDDRVDMLLSNDSPEAIAKSMGLGMVGFSQVYERVRPDILLVLGDRFEMHAAATAAVPFSIPIAHVHGGEVTNGAIDDAFRHAITKYSHLHFVSTPSHAERVIQLGEEPWRVTVSGAPGLDNLQSVPLLGLEELAQRLDLPLQQQPKPLLVTFHPVTLQHEQTADQTRQFLAALAEFQRPIVITKPNADTHGQQILEQLEAFAQARPSQVRLVDNLGTQAFFSLMAVAAAMVGNSSSGIIEAASFELPTVNIGLRQHGRARSANVLDVPCEHQPIAAAIRKALSPEFRATLKGMTNIYGSGDASATIVERLRTEPLDERLCMKRFHDLPSASSQSRVA